MFSDEGTTYFTAGALLPNRIGRVRRFGQDLSERPGHVQNAGGIVKAAPGQWRVDAGLFHSHFTFDRYAADFQRDITRDGIANRIAVGRR